MPASFSAAAADQSRAAANVILKADGSSALGFGIFHVRERRICIDDIPPRLHIESGDDSLAVSCLPEVLDCSVQRLGGLDGGIMRTRGGR